MGNFCVDAATFLGIQTGPQHDETISIAGDRQRRDLQTTSGGSQLEGLPHTGNGNGRGQRLNRDLPKTVSIFSLEGVYTHIRIHTYHISTFHSSEGFEVTELCQCRCPVID